MSATIPLDTIPEAIEAIRQGKVIIVVDDEDRENEGDFICAAEFCTPEVINFMAKEGRGLICCSLTEERCDDLGLPMMVGTNTASYETPFTVSVDLIGYGCTTGISASDRSKTIQALIKEDTNPRDLGRPGHIFPLRAKRGGVLRRTGHTEATVDFARLAGLRPGGALVEILNDDGTMARLPQLRKIADKFNLKLVSIKDLIAYRLENESLISVEVSSAVETAFGTFQLTAYRQEISNDLHFALRLGEWNEDEEVPVRVHSANLTDDVFAEIHEGESDILRMAMKKIQGYGKGLIVYMNQEHPLERLVNQLKHSEDKGPRLKMDNRDYGIGAQIIRSEGVKKMKLLTNSPKKLAAVVGYGLELSSTEGFA